MTESSNLQEEETITTFQPSREEASLSSLNNHHHQEEEEKKETDTSISDIIAINNMKKNHESGGSGSGGGGGGDTSTTKEYDGEDDDSDDDDDDDDDSSDDYDSDEERDDFSMSLREVEDEDETSFMSHDGSTDASSVGTEEQSITSGYSGFSGGTSTAENQSEADASNRKLTEKEDTAVRYGRILMYLLLISIGVVLSYTLFRVVRENELESFEESFTIWSDDLGTAWKSNIVDAFMALDSLSVDVTTSATTTTNISPENKWPFVTVPNYKIFSTVSLSSSTALITTSMVPRVIQSQRTEYENYTSSTLTTTEGFIASNNNGNNNNRRRRNLQSLTTTNVDSIIPSQIYTIDDNGQPVVVEDGSNNNDAYYPIRYIDPINLKSINYNLVSNSYMEYPIVESNYKVEAILGLTLDDNKNPDTTTILEMYSQTNNTDYLGTITFPILDDLSLISTNKDRTAVGVLPGLVSWNLLFDNNVLPTDINGIIAVVDNTCVQGFTMEINGAGASFVGIGDHHDPKFDEYKSDTFTLQNLDLNTATKVEFDNAASCNYEVSFYPSQITIDDYTSIISSSSSSSNAPVIYAVAVAVSFFIVLLVVCTYDCIQERRNQSVRKAAMEARAIVSSLFPAVVRDRLFETNRKERKERKKKRRRLRRRRKNKKDKKSKNGDDNNKNNNNADGDGSIKVPGILDTSMADMEMAPLHNSRLDMDTVQHLVDSIHMTGRRGSFDGSTDGSDNYKGNKVSHPKHRLKNYLSTPTSSSSPSGYGGGYDGSGDNKSEEFTKLGKPIADLFPHTTVLFADIVGFTAWSSEREPEQVFTLLQTVYHAFDRVAKRRGVFKVETIGDCYVAVTGLPDPQPDHAVRMAKFARECVTKMAELTKKLEVTLGPDTGDLCMRLGLHSGPVTAGVLMGEKSRFQLFGDTVNTASRMESTGEKNRIQISKSAADLLIEAGKSYWVKPREDLVHAKGKGQVQTFWLVGSRGSNLHASHSINSETAGALGLRRAPPRTRSALSSGAPVRGIKRAASESKRFGSDSAISQGSALNDRREERLIQWQVELFARLLKKIVASRAEKANKVDNNNTEEENPASELIVEDDNDNDQSEGSYRWTEELSVASGSVAPPADRFAGTNAPVEFDQDLSFRKPTRQPSLKFGMDSAHSTARKSVYSSSMNDSSTASFGLSKGPDDFGKIVFDEVAEIITLPKFSPEAIKALAHSDNVDLGETVMEQLKDYISTIAQLYRKNPFHNFEHASHVTMSANKLLNRIVIPENVDYERESNAIASDLHDYTYGITSDSLTQFAIVFSALVHDADHTGVPNAQLAKENPDMAILYRNQSIAEQNSVDLAWDLFMDPRYKDLQDCVAANAEERKRFRQLVVNSVMATDIFDKDMKELRNTRWDKAFHREATEKNRIISESSIEEDRNMKATIVIEHIIQASDVAHTMQHWHIYQKWNERLFEEMFSAFECGRSEKNPADFWYKGELWFFDNYVIPLAKKLEECNVFGVASDECLNYAEANRNEWSVKGEECIQQMVDRYHKRKFFVAGIAKKRHPKTTSVNRRMIMNRPENRIPAADPQTPPRRNVQQDDTIPGLPKRQTSLHRSSQH